MEIIVTHLSADFDSFAGMVAAKKLFPAASIVLPTAINSNVRKFISLYEDELPELTEAGDVDFKEVKKLIMIDTRLKARIGPAKQVFDNPGVEVIIYDHHLKTQKDLKAKKDHSENTGASTTILVKYINKKGTAITPLEATLFLIGIYEDTGSFTYPSTSASDLEAAAYLIENKADLFVALKFLNLSLSPDQHELLEKLIINSKKIKVNEKEILMSWVDMSHYIEGLSVLTRKLSQIEEVGIVICWARMKGKVYVVARNDDKSLDVSKVLGPLGGGGHPQAASAVLSAAAFEDIEKKVINSLKKNIDKPLLAKDIMSYPVRTISLDHSMKQVDRMLKKFGHSGVPIVGKTGLLVGIITRKDVDKAIKHGLSHAPVKGFKSHNMVKASPGTSINSIQNLMIENGIGRVPIVVKRKIVGIITRKDVLRYLYGRNYEQIIEFFPPDVKNILKVIAGVSKLLRSNTYLVGGIVRDALLGIPNYDIDIVVEEDGIGFGQKLADRFDAKLETHRKFGTSVIVLENGQHIDIATSRVEYYKKPAALPIIESGSIKQDLARRDFTINSLAVSLNKKNYGEILDYFGGRQDLKDKKIKILHKISFIEDPTRIFRAVRFEKRLGFLMDRVTEDLAITTIKMDIVSKLTGVRIRDELISILNEDKPYSAIKRLYDLGALAKIGIKSNIDKAFIESARKVLRSQVQMSPLTGEKVKKWRLLLIILFESMNASGIEKWSTKMKVRKKDTAVILKVLKYMDKARKQLKDPLKDNYKLYRVISDYPAELQVIVHSWGLGYRRNIKKYFEKLSNINLEIGGEDLKDMGYKPSYKFKEVLEELFALRLNGKISSRKDELQKAKKLMESIK
jgi:tRNA nucleotidyltransferase (CCA-adding enzyme)